MNKLTAFLIQLFFKDNASADIQTVFEKSFRVFILHLIALALVFSGNVLLARFSGDEVYGLYSLVFNWIAVLTIFAQAGMDDYHTAVIPGLHLQERYGTIRKILRISSGGVIAASLIVILVFNLVIYSVPVSGLSNHAGTFAKALWLILLIALCSNLGSFLRGYGVIVKSQLADKLIRPGLFLLLLLGAYFGYPSAGGIDILLAITGLSLLAALLYLLWLIRKSLSGKPATQPDPLSKLKFGRNKYYLLMSVLYLLTARLDILSLGGFVSVNEVGYYNVALKMADIIAYPTIIVNLVIPVFLAKRHFLKDRKELLHLLQNGSKATVAGCLVLIAGAVFGGKWLMGLYGTQFEIAFVPMLILCASQLITAFLGPVGAYFIVSGREKRATFCMLANVITTAACCFLFIPRWGATGAALASLSGNIIFNLIAVYSFYKYEKAVVTPFRVFGQF